MIQNRLVPVLAQQASLTKLFGQRDLTLRYFRIFALVYS
jgi:hypothetical protein